MTHNIHLQKFLRFPTIKKRKKNTILQVLLDFGLIIFPKTERFDPQKKKLIVVL
jgi:hypothetical protein